MSKLNVQTLNEERLRKSVDPEIFTLGRSQYLDGRVEIIDVKGDSAQCIVQDRHPYRVEIKVANNYLYLKCDCRYAYRGLICEHDIAACLAIRDILQQRQPPTWRNQVNKVLDATQLTRRKNAPPRYFLFFSLQETNAFDYQTWKLTAYHLPLALAAKSFPELANLTDETSIAEWLKANPQVAAHLKAPFQTLDLEGCINCTPQSVALANIFLERARAYSGYSPTLSMDESLTLIVDADSPLYLGEPNNPLGRKLHTHHQPGEMRLDMQRDADGIHIHAHVCIEDQGLDIKLSKGAAVHVIDYAPLWILLGDYLLKLTNLDQIELVQAFLETPEILIPAKDEKTFLEKYFLPLAKKLFVTGNLVEWQTSQVEPARRVYLSETEAGIQAEIRFGYAEIEVAYDTSYPDETIHQVPGAWTLVRVHRRPDEEKTAFEDLSSAAYGLKRTPNAPKPGIFSLRARVNTVDFLLHNVPRMIANHYEVYGEDLLTTARVNRNSPTISFQVSSGIDWFDVKAVVSFGELEVSLKEVRRAMRKNEHYIKLPDGTIGAIPEDWDEQYRRLFSLGSETEEGIRLGRHHVGLIDQALEGVQDVRTDRVFEDYRRQLLDFSGIAHVPLPAGFTGELRPYQKAGYDWLHFLHQYKFGGCLADDMGLGKTIQALTFLQGLQEGSGDRQADQNQPGESARASLIVVPRSLLVNWQREAARFTPSLNILEYFDSARPKDTAVFDKYDLVITTYGIMLRDIALLRKYNFRYILLDESQAIKNSLSQTARAARLLQGQHRLALTGTPIENSTQELWSQFAFLNPGLLGNLEYFKSEFIVPIEKKGDDHSAQILRKLVYPFVLRRTKDQVAPELPPRTERILYCDMEPAQRKLYNRTRDYYRGVVLGMLEKEGIQNTRFRILEGLLRLRQISNHPRLMEANFHGESGKFEMLLETLETLQAEGHKALVFSQFVQMLRILRQPMDERGIPYVYLDGHTRNRMELVDRYQNDPDIPFFLISLKAGGQGLNLTAADYVIHIDPWWNPAVEMQASDRTHRIGQEKPVFIFKLITRDSVEEKIILLQERKRRLVDQLITTESSFFKSLNTEDIQTLFS